MLESISVFDIYSTNVLGGSFRDIEACLVSVMKKLYHIRFWIAITRSNIAEANEHRDWRTYVDIARIHIHKVQACTSMKILVLNWNNTAYALNSTTTDLCLSLFP